MNKKLREFIRLLADGEFHSGSQIAVKLGVSRSAIWKYTHQFERLGLPLESVRGRGYRLIQPIDFLDQAVISRSVIAPLKCLEVVESTESTNDYLLSKVFDRAKMPRVFLAEHQSKGRGRYDRRWVSPYAQNLYCSFLMSFQHGEIDLHALSLVIGLAVLNTLQQLGVKEGLMIKWPNDVYLMGKKLAGILCEVRGEVNARYQVVIGVGINVLMQQGEGITQAWQSVFKALGVKLSRNQLAASLIDTVFIYLKRFREQGLAIFLAEYCQVDALLGRPLQLQQEGEVISGIGAGINKQGLLLLNQNGRVRAFSAGKVQLKK